MPGGPGPKFQWRQLVWAVILIAPAALAAPPDKPTTAPARRVFHRRVVVISAQTTQPSVSLPTDAVCDVERQKIRAIYSSDYIDASLNARRLLSRRMIEASDQTRQDLVAKFALLREARDVAANAGDVTTAFEVAERLAMTFPVSELTERIDAMKIAAPVLSTDQARLAAVSICMDLTDQCVIEGDYYRARVLLEIATNLVRQVKSVPHLAWIEGRAASIRPMIEAYETARPAEIKLSDSPDDPAANLVMGKFVAFVRGDLDAGLSMICKGSDEALAALSNQDLETPDDPAAELKMANAWWEMSRGQSPEFADALKRRAGFWYKAAQPTLDGLDKVLADRRLTELNPPVKPGLKRPYPPDALKLTASPPHWYRASIAKVSWDTAQKICQDSGGRLVCIETRAENELMIKLAKGRTLWLGASSDAKGKWSWLSGGNFLFGNWASGEPRQLFDDAHPIISANGQWRTVRGKAGFICEWSE